MPVSGCEPCRRFFVLDLDRPSRDKCPVCHQPLSILDQDDFQAMSHRLRTIGAGRRAAVDAPE
jgi:hypothetical protein